MFIKILFNYQVERTQGECVFRANGPDTVSWGSYMLTSSVVDRGYDTKSLAHLIT
jgi:hypothetical protein